MAFNPSNQTHDMETIANSIALILHFTGQNMIVPAAFDYVHSGQP